MLKEVEGTFCSSEGGNVAWFCADIIDNRRLKPRNIEMCSFLINIPTHATDPLILDSPVSSVHYPLDSGPSTQGVPLKMEALMAKTANPPTMTRPPSPSDPRGSFGGPPPAPRCLIISRKLECKLDVCEESTCPLDCEPSLGNGDAGNRINAQFEESTQYFFSTHEFRRRPANQRDLGNLTPA
jgi:hypothetical protein